MSVGTAQAICELVDAELDVLAPWSRAASGACARLDDLSEPSHFTVHVDRAWWLTASQVARLHFVINRHKAAGTASHLIIHRPGWVQWLIGYFAL